jgi:hypothetical protein
LLPTQKNVISIEWDCCRLTDLFMMPTTIALLEWTDVLGCGWPKLFRMFETKSLFGNCGKMPSILLPQLTQ